MNVVTLKLILALCMPPSLCSFPDAPEGQIWIDRHTRGGYPSRVVAQQCIRITKIDNFRIPPYTVTPKRCPRPKAG